MNLRRAIPYLLFAMTLALYLAGLAREPLPGDVSVYLRRAWELDIDGFAQTHPLFLALGKMVMVCLPFVSPPVAGGLLSAMAASLTVVLVFLIVRSLTGLALPACIGAGTLAVSHTLWFHAVMPEVYTLNAAFLAGMLYCAVRWRPDAESGERGGRGRWIFGVGMLGGLGCANHMLSAISLACCFAWILWPTRRENNRMKTLAAFLCGCLTGFIPLILLVAHDAGTLGYAAAVKMALVGGSGVTGRAVISYGSSMGRITPGHLARSACVGGAAFLYNFASPAAFLFLLGLWRTRRIGSLAILLPGLLAAHLLFGMTYAIHEAWAFLLPAWVVAAILVGLGVGRAEGGGRHLLLAASREGEEGLEPTVSGAVPEPPVPGVKSSERGAESANQEPRTKAPKIVDRASCLESHACRGETQRRPVPGSKGDGATGGWLQARGMIVLALSLLMPPLIYWVFANSAGTRMADKSTGRRLTGNEYALFYFWPPKGQSDREAQWMRQLMKTLPQDAIVALRPGYRALGMYLQTVEALRPDLLLMGLNDRTLTEAFGSGKTVFTDATDFTHYITAETSQMTVATAWHGIMRLRKKL